MSANINTLEVVILTDRMPRSLTALVKLPDGNVRTVTAHWDVAASQFTPTVTNALAQLVEQIIERAGVRPKRRQNQ